MPGIFANAIQESTQTIAPGTAVALGSNGFIGRAGITVFNGGGGGNLFLGGPNVTPATGIAVASNASVTIATTQGGSIYATSTLAGTVARLLEF